MNLPHNTYLLGCQLQFGTNVTGALAQPFLSVVQIQEADVELADDRARYRNNLENCILPETRQLLSSAIAVMLLGKQPSTDYQPYVNEKGIEPWMSAYGLLILPSVYLLFSLSPRGKMSDRTSEMVITIISYMTPTSGLGSSRRFVAPRIMYEFRRLALEVQGQLVGLVERSLQ